MRFSSMAMPGSGVLSEPVAIRIWLVFDLLLAAVVQRDLDLAGRGDARLALDPIDLVLLEEEVDALGIGRDHLVLLRHHGRQIELDARDLDAMLGEAVAGLVEALRGDAAAPWRGCSRY